MTGTEPLISTDSDNPEPTFIPDLEAPVAKSYEAARLDRYRQGLQAVFAGFVSAMQAKQLPATVQTLWDSDQLHLFLPSLRTLIPSADPFSNAGDAACQEMMLLILKESNKLTRPAMPLEGLTLGQKINIPWLLNLQAETAGILPFPLTLADAALSPDSHRSSISRTSIYEHPWWKN